MKPAHTGTVALAHAIPPTRGGRSALERAHAFVIGIANFLRRRERMARDRGALSAMSDRELQDIGLMRASTGPVASGAWLRDVGDRPL